MQSNVDALHAQLNAGYGFRVPRALPVAIAASEEIDLEESFALAWWTYGLGDGWPRYRSIGLGYVGFVPEFFAVGSPGVDGIQYGYVAHAPELDLGELPVFEFNPYSGLRYIAPDLQTALTDMAAAVAACAVEEGEFVSLDGYSALGRALGLSPTPVSSRTSAEQTVPFRPPVPRGWRYVESDDGIGALAPSDAFGGAVDLELFRRADRHMPSETLASLLDMCRGLLAAGYPGSALVGIRSTFITIDRIGGSELEKAEVMVVWGDVYEALGRPLLAEVVREAGATLREVGGRRHGRQAAASGHFADAVDTVDTVKRES